MPNNICIGVSIIREREIGFEVKTLSNLIKRKFLEGMEKDNANDLTGVQRWTIRYIYLNRDKDIFQKDIEKEFKIRRSTATGVLQLLEKNGYILREHVEQDARLKKLVLTDKAITVQKKIEKRITEVEKILVKGLTEEEIENFYSIIEKIKKNAE